MLIKGFPIYFDEGMIDAKCKGTTKWLMGLEEYHEGKKGTYLHRALKGKMNRFRRVYLIMVTCIDSIIYLNKNHEVFSLSLVHMVYQ